MISLALILCLGAFLRLYHVSDWLHFEIDQARDARVIDLAVNDGPGSLPLLGPRAGGTFLRLGPGFYYLEYVSAMVFGNTPGGRVALIALLSIASILVFYAFIRRYLPFRIALGLTLLFSVSAFLVLYGRFSWNPNPLPFFMLFGMYALLRAVDTSDAHRGRWLAGSAFLLGFATHLHFLAFVSLPIIVGAFLLMKRPRFSLKVWLAAIAIVIALYVPMILNETITGGANTQEFLQAVQGKSNKSDHTFAEQLVRNTTNHALGYWLILTGHEESAMGQFASKGNFDFELTCSDECHTHFASALTALLLFVSGIVLLFHAWWMETQVRKKDFLSLSMLWLGACFALFLPLSYDFSPRFFLLVTPFPFLFLGLIFAEIRRYIGRYSVMATRVLWLGLLLFIVSNTFFVTQRLRELERASFENVAIVPDRILKEKARVTLEQQEQVVSYMQSFQTKNGYPIYMFSEPEYRRGLKYLMERRGMQNDVVGFSGGVYAEGNYFLVFRTGSGHTEMLNAKYSSVYDVIDRKAFGTLTIIQLQPKTGAVTGKRQVFEAKASSSASAPGVPERYTWSEWWNHQGGSADDEPVDEEGE
ncbi:MAG: glycosyltransferase family 39 protein [Candidatus Moranbacteria bacterium]|nr:glycosyltransferase family 39 protein [Candidatus Moranbacteria bacterium]